MEWLIIVSGVAFLAFYGVRWYLHRKVMDELFEEYSEAVRPVFVNLEKRGDMVYAYTEENDTFVGQGTTKEGLAVAIAKNMPNTNIGVKKTQLKNAGFDVK